jgi:hypothetical protein
MWADREMEEEAYIPDHLLNQLTVKPPPPPRSENNGGSGVLLDGHNGHRSAYQPSLQAQQQFHSQHVGGACHEYLDGGRGGGGRSNGVDMMEPMLAHMGDQVKIRGLRKRCRLYLGWPIAPSYMSPNAGGGGVCGGLSQ